MTWKDFLGPTCRLSYAWGEIQVVASAVVGVRVEIASGFLWFQADPLDFVTLCVCVFSPVDAASPRG